MGEITVGSEVIDPATGQPTRVTSMYAKGERDVYRVTLQDGSSTEACDEHLWTVDIDGRVPGRVVNTMWMKDAAERGVRVRMPPSAPVETRTTEPLPIDPYVLGVLLGDAYLLADGSARLTCADPEMVQRIAYAEYKVCPLTVPNTPEFWITGNGLRGALRDLGLGGKLAHNKRIPAVYHRATTKDRLSLLQGLMDADGYVDQTGRVEFSSASPELAGGVLDLVRSLGGHAQINRKTGVTYTSPTQPAKTPARDAYRVQNINIRDCPFLLTRKAARFRPRAGAWHRRVKSVEVVRRDQIQCVAVAAVSHMYVVTDDYIPTDSTNDSVSSRGVGVYRLIRPQNGNLYFGRPAYTSAPPASPPAEQDRFNMHTEVQIASPLLGRT